MEKNTAPDGPKGPSPSARHPLADFPRLGFLKPSVDADRIEIGDYTYYDDPGGPEHFVENCVFYHYPFIGDRLVIGRFCAIASRVRFLMNGANHRLDGFSTYPSAIFGQGWEDPGADWKGGSRGDTSIGNDVWVGNGVTVLPGITVGDGAVLGAAAVVAANVPSYGIVAGNPAKVVKMRFKDDIVDRLVAVAWWNWGALKITRNLNAIRGHDIIALEAAA